MAILELQLRPDGWEQRVCGGRGYVLSLVCGGLWWSIPIVWVFPGILLQVAERLGWEANRVRKERGGGEGFQMPCLHLREGGT